MPSTGRTPMPSWEARKLKKVVLPEGGGQASSPFGKVRGVAGVKGVQNQGRERELVDHLGLVRAVAKVGDVLVVGDVGLGDENHVRRDRVQDGAEELDHPMRLLQVDAGGADLFPQVGDSVQADDLGPFFDVQQKDLDDP